MVAPPRMQHTDEMVAWKKTLTRYIIEETAWNEAQSTFNSHELTAERATEGPEESEDPPAKVFAGGLGYAPTMPASFRDHCEGSLR